MATTFSNFAIGLSILYVLTKEPLVLKRFSFAPFLIIESGLVFSFLILLKVWITLRIWRRMKDPENYDISFFGKKVYKQDVVKKGELAAYFLTLPFTLISGAYFLVNIFSK
ncbi:MAG TPA: hypothetical protein PKX79_10055 [Spirochaetota bacterium]|nr:hypothetical protein [Spirochaetota bacterium]HON15559.1 hypothetical protein [Spirochaetota bacterium]HPP95711.1 hypothetical protein [Spirochaetota bacterium]HPX92261.1 hypothetical protein [Spirochaetota bacterium]HRU66182.1 hypothetical protein [Spirochaetota bacterium]